MIIDSLSNYKAYCSINPNFEKAIDYVLSNISTIENGRYEIDGDRAFVMIVEATLKEVSDAKLEAHNKYIDIQIPFTNPESFGVKARELCQSQSADFDNDNDIIFYEDAPSSIITVTPSEFVIFFPSDGHAPLIGCGSTRKAIIKVAVI
ncbi:MAG: YhcH/YjgK/YiaL family protein [Rikenellaceae bacterium]